MSTEDELYELTDPGGPCCICGVEASHKHVDDGKDYCDRCCIQMMDADV